jgi:hypothetical protein
MAWLSSKLGGMMWRRGLLLAGIHLAVSLPLILSQEARDWRYIKSDGMELSSAQLQLAAWQEGETVTFNPCDGGFVDRAMSPLERVVEIGNLPVAAITGWHDPCSSPSSITRVIEGSFGRNNRRAEIVVSVTLAALVMIEWLLVGGFPLVLPRHWWGEPGAFITASAVAAALLVATPWSVPLSNIPLLLIAIGWLWWLGLLAWKSLRFGWRWTARMLVLRSD